MFHRTPPRPTIGVLIDFGRGEGSKKNPQPSVAKDWGFYPHAPFTVLSSKTFREEYPSRFSDSRIYLLLAPSQSL